MAMVLQTSVRGESSAQVYDHTTGTWKDSTSTPTPTPQPTVPSTQTTNASGSGGTTKTTDSKTEAEKEYIEIEFNTLVGDLTLTSTSKSIQIKVNDTIKLEGIGEYLSGLYFVSSVRRTLTKDGGYTHVFSLIKNGFGSSVKKASTTEQEETRKEEVKKESTEFKVGDTVRIVGDNAVYSNASEGVKVPAWVKQKNLTIKQISSDKNRVLLMPIFSWTYVKFIKKV